jgi:hypothetical protein
MCNNLKFKIYKTNFTCWFVPCKSWALTLRKDIEGGLKAVLRRIFEPKREELTG